MMICYKKSSVWMYAYINVEEPCSTFFLATLDPWLGSEPNLGSESMES